MRPIWKWLNDESGQSVIVIAISMVVLCGFAALAAAPGQTDGKDAPFRPKSNENAAAAA